MFLNMLTKQQGLALAIVQVTVKTWLKKPLTNGFLITFINGEIIKMIDQRVTPKVRGHCLFTYCP